MNAPYSPLPNNPFRRDLLAGKRLIGCWASLCSNITTEILQAAKKHGKACAILAPVEADARRYLEMGMTFVAVGGDTGLLRNAARALAQRFQAVT
jgi:2-keto-3-deoxy-L-rhamnonate aldolase RhmA